jgi:hypothetical protein
MKAARVKCTRCLDTYWVCEVHDDRPRDGENACGCGGAGCPVRLAMLPILITAHGCRRTSYPT